MKIVISRQTLIKQKGLDIVDSSYLESLSTNLDESNELIALSNSLELVIEERSIEYGNEV